MIISRRGVRGKEKRRGRGEGGENVKETMKKIISMQLEMLHDAMQKDMSAEMMTNISKILAEALVYAGMLTDIEIQKEIASKRLYEIQHFNFISGEEE